MHAAVDADVETTSAVHTTSRTLALEGGDTYEGAVQTRSGIAVPHGHGVWRSADGALRYEGHFVQRWRDGYGRLCTPAFTLWARWRMDRPDLSAAVRIDYANGDRYSGFIEWKVTPVGASKTQSKFSAWAASVLPVRQRWGEFVMQNGDTYVGEWRANALEGFGCYTWASGSRYVGRFLRGQFSDIGTLFMAPADVDGTFTRLSSGGWRCGAVQDEAKNLTAAAAVSASVARWPPLSRPSWGGAIADVVWAEGRCRGEGHVTLPSGVRVSADWRTASSPVDGELVLPALSPEARVDPEVYEWHESFQWESLFSSNSRSGGSGEVATPAEVSEKVANTRVNIQQSNSAEFVKSCLVELLDTHQQVKTALHVFRRCFYSLYGTCGAETEIGAGGGSSGLGWCALRNPYGGCLHRLRGRPIQAGDLDLALRDVASLARSVVRWVLETLGSGLQAKVLDCGGEAVIGRWVADRVFQYGYPVLLNLYKQVYHAEEAALAASVAHLRDAVSLDDMGVAFARQSESQARLFDPYTDAVHCVEQLDGTAQTLTTLLRVLVQWSREIDLSTRLTQASQEPRGTAAGRIAKPARAAAGSADDLLPIHQYVLSQSRCSHLYAVTRLLSDFANASLFMEATSQEAFGVTTLQVCVLTLLRLHPWERDEANILVPFSVTADRVAAAVQRRAAIAAWTCAALGLPTATTTLDEEDKGDEGSDEAGGVAEVEAFMAHYTQLWVPRLVGWVGEHVSAATSSFSLSDCDFTEEELALAQPHPSLCGEAVCFGCWLYASVLLGALHLRLHLDAMELPSHLRGLDDVKQACELMRGHLQGSTAAPRLGVDVEPPIHLIPSRMLCMEVHLSDLLSCL